MYVVSLLSQSQCLGVVVRFDVYKYTRIPFLTLDSVQSQGVFSTYMFYSTPTACSITRNAFQAKHGFNPFNLVGNNSRGVAASEELQVVASTGIERSQLFSSSSATLAESGLNSSGEGAVRRHTVGVWRLLRR